MEDSRSKKTVRQFNCRDALWAIFEEMARDLECSVDYLINEAMRQYAKSRRYAVPAAEQPTAAASASAPPPAPSMPSRMPRATPPGTLPPRPRAGTPAPMLRPSPVPAAPPPLAGSQPSAPPRPMGPPLAPPPPRPSLFPMDGRPTTAPAAAPPLPAAPPAPPPAPMPAATDPFAQAARAAAVSALPQAPAPSPVYEVAKAPTTGAGRAPLFLVFNGQRIPVRKEQFIIGRGLKSSDLAIKDTNISRRHAAVLFHNGAYYIKDLNSTNGIEYNGMRIDSKRIEEGDTFKICDYELRFTFH